MRASRYDPWTGTILADIYISIYKPCVAHIDSIYHGEYLLLMML